MAFLPPDIVKTLSLNAFSKHLFLLHDHTGTIVEFINEPNLSIFILLQKKLREEGTITPFFTLRSSTNAGRTRYYSQKDSLAISDPYFVFYTRLPQVVLLSEPIGNNLFLGRIAQIEFYPAIKSSSFNSIILVDNNTDCLLGFSDSFYKLFSSRFSSPELMLDMQASEFLSPTPVEFQTSLQSQFNLGQVDRFHKTLDVRFDSSDWNSQISILGGETSVSNDGLLWSNSSSTITYLLLNQPLNTEKNDFILSLEVDTMGLCGLIAILGQRPTESHEFPDSNGYSVGNIQSSPEQHNTLLKRSGDIVY